MTAWGARLILIVYACYSFLGKNTSNTSSFLSSFLKLMVVKCLSYAKRVLSTLNSLSHLTSQQPYFMDEATKKERLNELLTVTKFKVKLGKDWWAQS